MAQGVPAIFARIKNFEPQVNELRIFKGDIELSDEAESLNQKIMSLRNFQLGPAEAVRPIIHTILNTGIPLVQFPNL